MSFNDRDANELPGDGALPVNRSMPTSTVIPVLTYRDVPAAITWLSDAFGFTVRLRIGDHRAQLNAGAGALVIAQGEAQPERGHAVMIRVADVDAHSANATARGARIVNALATFPYGERQYSAIDPWGHVWTFSQTMSDVDPSDWGGVRG